MYHYLKNEICKEEVNDDIGLEISQHSFYPTFVLGQSTSVKIDYCK
jgi:hypothetical protein